MNLHLRVRTIIYPTAGLLLPLAFAISQENDSAPTGHLTGFYPEHQQQERTYEAMALERVSRDSLRQYLFDLTRIPHQAGSKGDEQDAAYVRQKLTADGFTSTLATYDVLLPYPVDASVAILSPEHRELRIKEHTTFAPGALIPFNAYSPDGDVTGDIVYANYGGPDDYETLRDLGISPRGKIVLVRYGRSNRGLKVHNASEEGAIGIILYSDPADDGYMAGDVYPKGPMRPWDGVQRGSIRLMEHYPGDPLTPGWGATPDAKRIPADQDPDMPTIPCIPISYDDAQYLLRPLEGQAVPRGWQGGLPFTYHIGPGPVRVRVRLSMDNKIRPIWNNIATLRGTDDPDHLVILAGHRDAWIFGAQDPNSGSAVLLEAARTLGYLVEHGWRPRRTIMIGQWDGEEYGMIGSTEWGEDHERELRENALVYMNFDGTVSGPSFGASAVPSLDAFVQSLTRDVTDPRTGKSIFEAWWKDQHKKRFKRLEETIPENAATNVGRLGGGSDHVVFLNHIGVPSMGFGFGGPNGVYHSYYDNFDWMERFGDPGFAYHAAATQIAVLAAMRMASADILPFTLAPYADEILKQVNALQRRLSDDQLQDSLRLDGLKSAAEQWHATAARVDSQLALSRLDSEQLQKVNQLLASIERTFVPANGLPGRAWYRHRVVVASGYASVGLPGISGAIDQRNWQEAANETALLESIIGEARRTTATIGSLLQ